MTPSSTYVFASFRLLPAQRLLLSEGEPLKVGSRAFDLLVGLVEHHDRVVTKQELLDLVWPDDDVGEANLAVHVLALRKLLGRSSIANVAGRGYRFTLPLKVVDAQVGDRRRRPRAGSHAGADEAGDEALFGRDAELAQLQRLLVDRALVTVVGAGGVGKSRLAREVVARWGVRATQAACWIELAPLTDPQLVAATVARALRVATRADRDAVAAVTTVMRSGSTLLVLDNAEHVLAGVVRLAAALGEHAPQTKLLVTSQEALKLPGEAVLRLEPLALPGDESLRSAQLSAAVALFEARARRLTPGFGVHSSNRSAVVEICRRLDGIPLAIELAAARLPLLGLEGIRVRLTERLRFLASGHPHPPMRHQTLRTALDWSHSLLDEAEQRLLRRLSVFAGGFTLDAAQQVAQDAELDAWGVLDTLGGLLDKSLVVSNGQAVPRFQLLETTRLYARERLILADEQDEMRERHARALEQALRVPQDDGRLWRTPPASTAELVAEVDNARAAIEWVSARADDELAVRLAAGASHVFLAASLNAEFIERVLPLRSRVHAEMPASVTGLFWARLALACSRNAHPAGLDASLRAAQTYRAMGEDGRLYDALTWLLAIASRHGWDGSLKAVVDEAEKLERREWPPALRSSFQWAKHRWLLSQGRPQEALHCAQAQADLLAEDGLWIAHVALGANVADCELAMGRVDQAEALSREALEALDSLGIDENLVGHVMDALMIAMTLQGRDQEALAVGRRARRLLEREGDELRLLDTLALHAANGGRWADAAKIAGHVDADMARTGEKRWPSAAARWARLELRLQAMLDPESGRRHRAAGAALSRTDVFDLAFGDTLPVRGSH